jgi:hypothetical protein
MAPTVEVLSVGRAIETTTGAPIYQVAFGHIAELTEEVKNRIREGGGQVPPGAAVGANVLILWFPFDGVVPYRIGSRWNLEVGANGRVVLEEVG